MPTFVAAAIEWVAAAIGTEMVLTFAQIAFIANAPCLIGGVALSKIKKADAT